ncbi:replication protein A 32 kDa subunit-B-like isoform X2 [Polistes fuscatus]|uniref:replication protein A 32 kDa subunit-B-like isoform X2 n=1 Tax=Polistes fuscatus TaxID=30207 RepID=UPI001CA877B1|nr:replication protein A 32 kDa subunit-B-like isoform X2 [Polistes fuscatus]
MLEKIEYKVGSLSCLCLFIRKRGCKINNEKKLLHFQYAEAITETIGGQILRSSDNLELWGIPVCSVLVIVGILRSINESTTKITYEVEDETAIRWLKAKRTKEESSLKINNYVRIVSRLHIEKGVKQIVIMRIQNLDDLNELTNHLLEVTY